MQTSFFSFFLLIFISKELFFFDEELLVVLSFFLVFSTLFRLLSTLISSELENRKSIIFQQFIDYLSIKKELIELVIIFYEKRLDTLLFKFLDILIYFVCFMQEKMLNDFISLTFGYYRFILNKLTILTLLEDLSYKKEILNLTIENHQEKSLDFFLTIH